MINDRSVLAVIPARSGSKGLKGKNILQLNGKPLIAWTIEAARGSKYIDNLLVSTDDKKISEIANKYHCQTPFLRPLELSLDETPTIDVILHAINYYLNLGKKYDYFILLEPTSPLRDSHDIDKALELLDSSRDFANSIVGVSKVESSHPFFDVKIKESGLIEPYANNKFKTVRRQDIDELFYFEGSIYISKTDELINEKSFLHEKTLPYTVPRWKSLEIDELLDLILAESIMNNLKLLTT